jgi:hypothetical protein
MSYGENGSISSNAFLVANDADTKREDIMSEIKNAVSSANTGGSDVYVNVGGSNIDISTGAGALVLDDTLQKLSTQEQSAAQILSAQNRATKEVSQQH